ncbi:hypothetical protein COI79_00645 [Bacillus thuringiensis]|uniref:Uncharacterized protein n=1 Tax=Bacillus thuringiensis TaxID=1428 RepID=A0ABD6S3C9_BACTU|nr:hypothetical protein BK762_05320 [Bacillus thuringiensis serovar toumanoffi]PER52495.1 hypothetical protein CN495_15715 [Bacillus thuringiensis]PEU87152.1 hypothetical protein CN411_15040 [Bacillus thuringiensis]PFF45577.1 hypothetical protein CN335_03185 [Bacillus thuringiensis]PFI13734.1 hypothetical protein COI79_00645 [Bacillus thuringiensis]
MGDQLSVKARLVQLIISGGWKKTPLIKVSLYYNKRYNKVEGRNLSLYKIVIYKKSHKKNSPDV